MDFHLLLFQYPARRASLRVFAAPPVELAPGRGLVCGLILLPVVPRSAFFLSFPVELAPGFWFSARRARSGSVVCWPPARRARSGSVVR